MPIKIRKLPKQDLYRVYNSDTGTIHSYATTLKNAEKQKKLLHMVDANVPLKKEGGNISQTEKEKSLSTENKIFSNNNKMQNYWVEHVKEYASGNGMSYRDALRCPNCKEEYKNGGKLSIMKKKGKGVIDESKFSNQVLLADTYNSNELGPNAGKKYIKLK